MTNIVSDVITSQRGVVVKVSICGLLGQWFNPRPRQTKVLKFGTLAAVLPGVGIKRLVSYWLARCQYKLTGWGIRVVLDSTSLWGSTLIKVHLAPSQ